MSKTKVVTINDYKKPVSVEKFPKSALMTETDAGTEQEGDELLEQIGMEIDRLQYELVEEKGDKQGLLESAKKLAQVNKKNEHRIKELEAENTSLRRENDKITNKRSEYSVKYQATRDKLLKNQSENTEELIQKKAEQSTIKYNKLLGI